MNKSVFFSSILLSAVFFAFSFSGCNKKEGEPLSLVPSLSSLEVEIIDDQTVTISGSLVSDGGAEVSSLGICWGTQPDPTTSNNVLSVEPENSVFERILPGLQIGQYYYARAFAVNSQGTGYGSVIKFTTVEPSSFSYQGQTISVFPVNSGSFFIWGETGIFLGADNPGNGLLNTITIAAQNISSAAKACNELVAYGENDWYLPSINELQAMYENQSLVGPFTQEYYWSSTETDEDHAKSLNFENGVQADNQKNIGRRCRCIRRD